MWHKCVSSSISKFDLLKSNEETALGLGGVPFENTSGNAEYNQFLNQYSVHLDSFCQFER